MNINTRNMAFVNFNEEDMQWFKVDGVIVYEAWKKLIASGVPPLTLVNSGGKDLVDYKIAGNSVQSKLPSEYQEVEYIQNERGTKVSYINTGVVPNANTGIDMVYQALEYSNSQYILGTRESAINYAMNGSSSRTDWDIRFDGLTIYSNIERTADKWRSKIKMTNGNGTWEITNLDVGTSKTISISNKTVTATLPLGLFCYNATNEANIKTYVHYGLRVYSCKLYDGETLIRDFVPCFRKSDDVVGMYDLVNNVFYTSASTGVFTKGNNVPAQNIPIEIESVGEYDETTGKYKIPVKSNEVITNIYLDEPLRKVGEYADYVDYKNKKVVRKVGVKTFDGSETWVKHTTTTQGYGAFRSDNLLTPLIGAPISATYMTHFTLTDKGATAEFVPGEYRFTYSSGSLIAGSRLYVSAEQTTVEDFTAWLSENKPSIYYPIATPIEEKIELPNIPTNKGASILSIDTIIQPSNLEVVYKGK